MPWCPYLSIISRLFFFLVPVLFVLQTTTQKHGDIVIVVIIVIRNLEFSPKQKIRVAGDARVARNPFYRPAIVHSEVAEIFLQLYFRILSVPRG